MLSQESKLFPEKIIFDSFHLIFMEFITTLCSVFVSMYEKELPNLEGTFMYFVKTAIRNNA